MEMKIVEISKSYRRVISDNNYGSVSVGSEVKATVEVANQEELLEASKKLARIARVTAQQDYEAYLADKQSGKVA